MNKRRRANIAPYHVGEDGGILMMRNHEEVHVDKRKVPKAIRDELRHHFPHLNELPAFGDIIETNLTIEDPWGEERDLGLGPRCGWMVDDQGNWTHLPTSIYHRFRNPRNDKKANDAKESCQQVRKTQRLAKRRARRRAAQNQARKRRTKRKRSLSRARRSRSRTKRRKC